MIKIGLTTVLAISAALSVAVVNAQGSAQDDRWLLSKYDANGDRVISVNEIEDRRKRVFSAMDQNHDGDVSFSEYESIDNQRRHPILKARFDKLDLDRNGELSGQEYASYLGSFDRMDTNSDGQVTADEMNLRAGSKKKNQVLNKNADACLLWLCVRKRAW